MMSEYERAPSREGASRAEERSFGLEERIHLHLLAGAYTASTLAAACGASVPTLARALARLRVLLRKQGMELVSVRSGSGYRYEILGAESHARNAWRASRLRSLAGSVPERKPVKPVKAQDEAVYGRDW